MWFTRSEWKYSSPYTVRNQIQRFRRWLFVFLMCVYQSSYVSSRICAKESFLDDNQEHREQVKYEFFCPHHCAVSKRPFKLGSIVFLFRCWLACSSVHVTLTSYTVSPQVFTFMYPPGDVCQSVTVHSPWSNHGETPCPGGLDTRNPVRDTEWQGRWLTRYWLVTNSPWNRDEDYDTVVKSEKGSYDIVEVKERGYVVIVDMSLSLTGFR